MFKIEDFIGKYPELKKSKESILNPYEDNFYSDLFRKKEFYEKRLSREEEPPSEAGVTLSHQDIVSRFMSSNTNYNSLLVCHEMGTGKTGVAISVAEKIKREHKNINRALVLMRGRALVENFIRELVFVNTRGEYIPEDYDKLSERQKLIRIHKNVDVFYDFNTFETFSKKLSNMPDELLRKTFSNQLIIIDEVHNLRMQDDEKNNIYDNIFRLLHNIDNCKILLLSATPMKDRPDEIASILNLILPLDNQLPIGDEFLKKYMNKVNQDLYLVKEDKNQELKEYFKGRISYLKAPISDIKKEFVGERIGELRKFIVEPIYMDSFQSTNYLKAINSDKKELKGIYSNSRQAVLFVFPDGSWGSSGFGKYVTEQKNKLMESSYSNFVLSSNLQKEIVGATQVETLEKIKKFSYKYYQVIKNILENKDKSTFIYCDMVEGSGAIILGKLLELVGFSQYKGNSKEELNSKKERYSIITNRTATPYQIKNIINEYNSSKNLFGEYLRVIIGSKVISEGFSLKNVRKIHILTPFWNYTETDQAIARGIRIFSHKDLIKRGIMPKVDIHQYVCIPDNRVVTDSIDYIMFLISELKDLSIKQIERLLRESAFDCALNFIRNYNQGFDNDRICEYMECKYQCDGQQYEILDENKLDKLTYNLYYSDDIVSTTINKLSILFTKKNIYTYGELIESGLLKDEFVVLKSLNKIISENITLKNKNNQDCYLKNYDELYFLDINLDKDVSITSWQYIDNPIFYKINNMEDILTKAELKKSDLLVEKIKKSTRNDYETIFEMMSMDMKEEFIEGSILSKISGNILRKELVDWVLEHYKDYIINIQEYWISKFLYSDRKILRCLDTTTKKWFICSEEVSRQVLSSEDSEIERLKTNKYGYYGIIEKSGKFRISDRISEKQKEKINKKTENKGRVCSSWNKKALLRLIHNIGLKPFKNNEFQGRNKKELISIISSNKQYADMTEFKDSEISEMTSDQIADLLFWSEQSVTVRCSNIEKWFKEKNLLILH